jgi:hypothetical protein
MKSRRGMILINSGYYDNLFTITDHSADLVFPIYKASSFSFNASMVL